MSSLRLALAGSFLGLSAVLLAGADAGAASMKREPDRKAPAPPKPAPPAKQLTPKAARAAYPDRVSALERTRKDLAARWAKARTETERKRLRLAAKTALTGAMVDGLMPAWEGTAWNFHGTTTTPGSGTIACGYYVTTILEHAGFQVERARLAQQPSERIVKTLAPASDVWRFRKGDRAEVLAKVRAEGDGIYVVGLDNHVGFLVERAGSATRFCHASYDPPEARCEDASKAKTFASNYHVVGRVLQDTSLERWIRGGAFETVKQ